MGQICDCLFRTHQHNRLNEIEEKILKYEQFMEQWLVNNSCCDTLYKKRRDDGSFFKLYILNVK